MQNYVNVDGLSLWEVYSASRYGLRESLTIVAEEGLVRPALCHRLQFYLPSPSSMLPKPEIICIISVN